MSKAKSDALRLKDVLLTSRPFWWITTAVPFVAGYLLTEPEWSWTLAIGALYFLFAYNLLMYGVNDVFDYESDIRNPRKAGIEGAVLTKRKHKPLLLVIHLINIPFIAYLVLAGDASAASFLAIILFMAYAYSVPGLRFKERAGLDSLTSAFRYASPFIFGILLAGGTELFLPGWIAFFLWAASNHAFGAIQDIKPDKQAGIRSVATRFGTEKVLIFCLSAYSVAAALPTIFYGVDGLPVSLALLAYVALVWRTVRYREHDTNPIFHRSWQRLTVMNYVCGGIVSMYLIYMVGLS